MTARDVIFVSHASGPDNTFATWISARLAMAGYKVWCDQEKLLGGEDFWKDIETELRANVVKFVLVISKNMRDSNGSTRDGVAKEIAVADALKKKLGDPYYIIPAVIDDTPFDEFGIEFIRLNGVDFKTNWATGLAQLIKVLERDSVPHSADLANPTLQEWRNIHKSLGRALAKTDEVLQSNWLSIEKMPENLNFYEVVRPVSLPEMRSIASACSIPCANHGRLLATFATFDELQTALGDTVPVKPRGVLLLADFLAGKTGDILGIAPSDARNKVSSMVRQAWDESMRSRGLTQYEMANQKLAWWFPSKLVEDDTLRYSDLNGKSRRRAVMGVRGKKELGDGSTSPRYYWHLGFTSVPLISDASRLILRPRVIISEDGSTPLENKTKLNSVRRKVTGLWFNDKWRGLVMGFCTWLANGEGVITLKIGTTAEIVLSAKPAEFEIDTGITTDPSSNIPSDDDEAQFEEQEIALRLSDPAFANIDDDDDDDEK